MVNTASTISKSDQPIAPTRLVLGCGALVHEMVAILNQNPTAKVATKLHCLPAKLHNTPQFIAREVDAYLKENAALYEQIFIAYGDCGTGGELDRVLQRYGATRLEGAHCYEFYSGQEVFASLVEDEIGSFYLTDYLVKNFDQLVIAGLGLDRHPELFDQYFKHYKKMVYLAQIENRELRLLAKQYADDFGWDFEFRLVGMQGLQPIANINIPVVIE